MLMKKRTSCNYIPWPIPLFFQRGIVLINLLVLGHLNHIHNRSKVWYRNSLSRPQVWGLIHQSKARHTFGFPVVPLEKLRNATFVFASPFRSLRSTKFGSLCSPCWTRASTDIWFDSSKVMTRSDGKPAAWAASNAVCKEEGCAMIKDALTILSWYSNSLVLLAGFAHLW